MKKVVLKVFLGLCIIIGVSIGLYFLYFKIKKETYLLWYNKNYSKYKQKDSIKLKEDYRNIFCYWDTEELPPLINECIKKIKKEMGSKWNVILLNRNTVYKLISKNDFPKNYEKLQVQHKTDWIRLYLLKKHGGSWMDISIVLNDPQEIEDIYNILMNSNKNLCCYEMYFHRIKVNNKEYPGIENWFIMAKANSEIINKWLKEFEYAIEIGFDKYSEYINKNNYILSENCKKYKYLTVYRCIQVLMQKYDINLDDMYIKDAKETIYKIIQNPAYILKNKCKHNIKLAHYDRDYLNKYLKEFIELYF
jgi:predicted acetyltransferase